jgi:opacity protein-like surface antigen
MSRVSCRQLIVVTLHLLLITLAVPREGRAQGFISPFLGFNFGGDAGCPEVTGCEDKNLNLGVGLGVMGSVLGFEEEFGYARDFFGKTPGVSSNVLTLMSNLMIVPKIGPVRPFVTGGVGLIKTHVELTPSSVLTNDNNSFGWDMGGGIMGFFGDHVGVRGEIRYFHAFKDLELLGVDVSSEKIDFGRASAGVVFKF